jgi:hypothetical protein
MLAGIFPIWTGTIGLEVLAAVGEQVQVKLGKGFFNIVGDFS